MVRAKGLKLLPTEEEIDGILAFDDLTLSSLVGSAHAPIGDGVDNDNPYRALPLERWRDRGQAPA